MNLRFWRRYAGFVSGAFARNFYIGGELRQSQSDFDEVARVISQRTVQKIDDIYPGREKETIYVACGYSDQLSEEPHLTGDTFTLEKDQRPLDGC